MPDELTEEQVRQRIKYAETLHGGAQQEYLNIKGLLTRDYDIPDDVEDLGIDIFQPSKAAAIIGKATSILRSRAKETTEIVPLNGTQEEQEKCSRLEKFAESMMRRGAEGRRVDPYLTWIQWFAIYGKGCLEWRYFPQFMDEDSEFFPIRPVAPAADTVCEVSGDTGVLYYIKSYQRMKLDILTELEELHDEDKEAWDLPTMEGVEDTKFIDVVEYWDSEWKALLVADELVWLNKHEYGGMMLDVAYCEAFPFEDDAVWWGQGMLRPVGDDLKAQAGFQAKMLAAVDLQFWATVLIKHADGMAQILQGMPGALHDIGPDADVILLPNTINEGLLEHVWSRLDGDINQMTGLPELSFGKEPAAGSSGYMVAQILGQIMDRFKQKLDDIGTAKAQHIKHGLRLAAELCDPDSEWGDVTDGKGWSVAAEPEPGKRKATITVSYEDLKPVREVHVTIEPILAQEEVMHMEMAERARQGGTDGRPMLSDHTLHERYIKVESPDEERERIDDQMMQQHPDVVQVKAEKWIEEWQSEQDEDKKKGKAPPGPQEYECPQCGFKGMAEEQMEGKPCPNCGAPLELASVSQTPDGSAPTPAMAGQYPTGGPGGGAQVAGLPSQMGGSTGIARPPASPEQMAQQAMGQRPPMPRR